MTETKLPSQWRLIERGGTPLELMIEKLDIDGFNAIQEWSKRKFLSPCMFYAYTNLMDLNHQLEPEKGYPLDWLIFHI